MEVKISIYTKKTEGTPLRFSESLVPSRKEPVKASPEHLPGQPGGVFGRAGCGP